MSLAFVFPGQGSQEVGMGRSWAEDHSVARSTFEEADETLSVAVSRLCWEGPASELQLTANLQPAILTVSTALHRVLAERGLEAAVMAGHSLGEYSALVASGALDFADALRLVRRRGELMQEAVPVGEGAMAAVLGLDVEAVERAVEEASREDSICRVANLNAPGQIVVAGHAEAVDRAITRAEELGARRAVLLPVSAPFHSPLMRPAREGLDPLLRGTAFRDPSVPVVTNVDARPVTDGEAARDALVRQVDSPVRWIESVEWMIASGAHRFVEIGPGRVLSGLVRRVDRNVETTATGEGDGLDELLREIEGEAA